MSLRTGKLNAYRSADSLTAAGYNCYLFFFHCHLPYGLKSCRVILAINVFSIYTSLAISRRLPNLWVFSDFTSRMVPVVICSIKNSAFLIPTNQPMFSDSSPWVWNDPNHCRHQQSGRQVQEESEDEPYSPGIEDRNLIQLSWLRHARDQPR